MKNPLANYIVTDLGRTAIFAAVLTLLSCLIIHESSKSGVTVGQIWEPKLNNPFAPEYYHVIDVRGVWVQYVDTKGDTLSNLERVFTNSRKLTK